MNKMLTNRIIPTLGLMGFSTMSFAADAPKFDGASTAWMITATVLVILMTIPGLGLFYGGLVRAKNMLSVLTQVVHYFFDALRIVGIVWLQSGLYPGRSA